MVVGPDDASVCLAMREAVEVVVSTVVMGLDVAMVFVESITRIDQAIAVAIPAAVDASVAVAVISAAALALGLPLLALGIIAALSALLLAHFAALLASFAALLTRLAALLALDQIGRAHV